MIATHQYSESSYLLAKPKKLPVCKTTHLTFIVKTCKTMSINHDDVSMEAPFQFYVLIARF